LLINRIIVSLGGKAAETIEYGENNVSVGASEDLKQANELARDMIEQYGMGRNLEVFSHDKEVHYSDKTLERMDKEIMDIVQYCYTESKVILMDKGHQVNVLTEMLLNDNVLDGKTVSNIANFRW
jgi:ATP-dependent Zn protease